MLKRMSWMRWAVAVMTVLVMALLAWQCIDIYLDGNAPSNLDANGVHLSPVYSVEIVAARLQALMPVLILYMLLVLAALVMETAAGTAPAQRTALTPQNRLRLMKARVAELPEAARAEERVRKLLCSAITVVVLCDAALCLAYLLNGKFFVSWDLEMVMGQMLRHVAPLVLVAFATVIAASYAFDASVEREIAALKDAPKAAPQDKAAVRRIPTNAVRVLLYAVAAVFIMLGVMNGGLRDVLVKAINICTECIGLG
ncbi:MAG: hypothetical protein IJ438_00030 [Clostridia bacterium]|nr:hypothetical protein [Clostridia bacterium]